MKGVTNYFGSDRLSFLLHNDGGNAPKQVEAANERIETYGMQAFLRTRVESEKCARTIVPMFNHFGYGYIVIDDEGNLRGSNLHAAEMMELVGKLLSDEDEEQDESPIAARTTVEKVEGGKTGFDLSHYLPAAQTSKVTLTLTLPKGYHIYGMGPQNPEPTKVAIAYHDRLEVGEVTLLNAKGDAAGPQQADGPVRLTFDVTAKKGTPIGNYFVHGTIRFMACDAHGCLPAMELPWTARIPLL